MSERGLSVVRAIHYLEYVAEWEPIPFTERPAYRVCLIDGEWVAVLVTTRENATP